MNDEERKATERYARGLERLGDRCASIAEGFARHALKSATASIWVTAAERWMQAAERLYYSAWMARFGEDVSSSTGYEESLTPTGGTDEVE